jgi:hypothetical protein
MKRAVAAFAAILFGCQSAASEPSPVAKASSAEVAQPKKTEAVAEKSAKVTDADPSFRKPAADRVVAIGDLHGDLAVTRRALRLAGAIDARDRWIGGKLVVVQTGDEIDRGDDDRAIVELFDSLADAAEGPGGRLYALLGNHEIMNASLDFRYVTRGGFAAFSDVSTTRVPRAVLERFQVTERGRVAAFVPGGPYARKLSSRPPVLMVGDTVFVHGGVTVAHVQYGIGRFNREVRRWLEGEGAPSPLAGDPEGPLWTRRFSADDSGIDCDGLKAALAALGAARMVVGHTVHSEGITAACDNHVYRIDTGLAAYYHGPTQVLEIRGSTVQPLKTGD